MFSHNLSCSLTHNSTDIYTALEGTNGSVHSRFNFRPMGDGSIQGRRQGGRVGAMAPLTLV